MEANARTDRPARPTDNSTTWTTEQREIAYRRARRDGLVVAPPLNPPIEPQSE